MRIVYLRPGRCLSLCLLLVVLTACGAAPSGQTDTTPSASPSTSPGAGQQPGPITDMNSLIVALRSNGLTVETAGTVSQPFFDVQGTQVRVQDADVQVFEFADAEAANAAVALLGPDGNPRTMMIEWVAPPHFYQAGRLVVLYVGDDAVMTQALTDVLGAQVAGR